MGNPPGLVFGNVTCGYYKQTIVCVLRPQRDRPACIFLTPRMIILSFAGGEGRGTGTH